MKTLYFTLTILLLLLISEKQLLANTITSTAEGGSWNKKETWDQNVVPTAEDDVIIVSRVTLDGGQFHAKNLTVNEGGTIIRPITGGFNVLNVHGTLTNHGTIMDEGSWFDVKLSGDFINHGVFSPRSLTFQSNTPTLDVTVEISSVNIYFDTNVTEVTALSDLHFNSCSVRQSSSTQSTELNMGIHTLTLSSDHVGYDGYYGSFSSDGKFSVPLRFAGSGVLTLDKAILEADITGDVIINTISYGFLDNNIDFYGNLQIDETARLLSTQYSDEITVHGDLVNYGRFATDTVTIEGNDVAPKSARFRIVGNLFNYNSMGVSTVQCITDGKTIQVEGDFTGELNFLQSLTSEKPGGKVVVNHAINMYDMFRCNADCEVLPGGTFNNHSHDYSTFRVDQANTFTNQGKLKTYHYVNNNWDYRKYKGIQGAYVDYELRDWDGDIDGLEILTVNNETYPGLPASTKRWWRITPIGEGEIEYYTVKFYYDEALLNGQSEENLKLYHSTDSGETWNIAAFSEYVELNTDENYISVGDWTRTESMLTEMGDFVISSGDGSVPIASSIKIDMQGRKSVRIGAPNPFTVHLYNLTDLPTDEVLIAIHLTPDMQFKEVHYPHHNGVDVVPVDSLGYPDDDIQVFYVPGLEANEHVEFDVIVYGLSNTNRNDYQVTLTGAGYLENLKDAAIQEYIVKWIGQKAALNKEEEEEYRVAMGLSKKQMIIEKKKYGRAVTGIRNVAKYTVEQIANTNPVSKVLFKVGDLAESVYGIKDDLRRRLFHWFYKEIGLIPDKKGQSGKQIKGKLVQSWDPNEIVGPAGYGDLNYLSEIPTMQYTIMFENKKEATAPAYRVQIIDTLSEAFDLETVKFGRTSHEGESYNWKIEREGNILKWDIEGIELPPNQVPPEGEGWVKFSAELKSDAKHGDVIENKATIIFDMNEPITTNTWTNILDFEPPQTTMQTPEYTPGDTIVTIKCDPNDNNDSGVGLISYYASKNGGMFLEIGDSRSNEITYYVGDEIGNTYRFYAIAEDNVENKEVTIPDFVEIETTTSSSVNEIPGPMFTVFPNPVGNNLNIIPEKNIDKYYYTITDVHGRVLRRGTEMATSQSFIHVGDIIPGIIILTVQTENAGSYSIKLLKM